MSTAEQLRELTEQKYRYGFVTDIEATCLAKASWDPVSRAIHGALSNLPLSAIAPFRAGDPHEAPAPVTLRSLGVNAR